MLTRQSDHFKAFIITFVMWLYIFMRCRKNSVFTEDNAISQRAVRTDLFLFISQNEECSRGMVDIGVLARCMMTNIDFNYVPASASSFLCVREDCIKGALCNATQCCA